MTTKTNEAYLYILMRTDMASMNPGKAVAQGAHAANMFGEIMAGRRNTLLQMPGDEQIDDNDAAVQFIQWQGERMFGTTITLGVNYEQLLEKVKQSLGAGFVAGICHDPTYPLRDGDYTHLIPVDTCGYVFGSKEDLSAILGDLELMK